MPTIGQLLSRDLAQPIEEVIKLYQQDELTVYREISEYVATDRIKAQYVQVLQAMADAPSDPTEGVGVWVSGFFGSGKSSFAKNLGYILANRPLQGQPASQLFVQQLQKQAPTDPMVGRIADLAGFLTTRFDNHVIMFDVQVDRAVRKATEPIAEIMYSVLLRDLDYAQDYGVAELEIELEGEGRLAHFVKACATAYGDLAGNEPADTDGVPATLPGVSAQEYGVWQRVRKGAQRIQRASATLHAIDPATYPTPESWAASVSRESDITIRTLVERTFELTGRRRPGHAVVFIVDEVGAYVARSADKIENLRAVVEHFGQESKNRVQAGKASAPVWVIVTSQEKLDEVVAAIDDKRVQLARLQDRFKIRIDMAPADIREVATRRVLAKKAQAEPALRTLYGQASPQLKTHTRLERTSLRSEVSQEEFVQFYPYLPHFIDLSIDIVSGIRLQAGAPRHIGGSNRTIIKQTYEMLVSDRTRLADEAVGALVSLDRIFDLVEGNLSSEKQRDISDIASRWGGQSWEVRTAKAIALLEYVRDMPRSDVNLAALLYRRLGDESPLPQVQAAIAELQKHQFIRQTEHGWKLQTAQEKSWLAERNAHNPTPKEQHDILEDRLRAIFSSANLTRYRYRANRTFRVGVSWNNRQIAGGDAQVPLLLHMADDGDSFAAACAQATDDSRAQSHRNDIFWVWSMTNEIDEQVRELYRSQSMVGKYDQLRAQGKLTAEEGTSLTNEKSDVLRLQERLRERLETAMAGGRGFFRGVGKDGAALGRSLPEILKGMFDFAVPDLYPKLEMGARPLQGKEAEEILKAANLNGLSKVFYGPPDGLDLVAKEGSKVVVNLGAPIVKEVADYLAREHSYGNKVTGRTLEGHFGGIGYGWEGEMLWLVLATLLRGGAVEVTYQGRRYRNHLDPQVRTPFSGANAFRSASFAPRKAPDLQTLVTAARRYEELTGDEVDVEESAIAQAFQRLARSELEALLPLEATVRANAIPGVEATLQEYHSTLETVLNSASDDCVNMLAGEGASFQQLREQVRRIGRGVDAQGLAYLRRLRAAVQQLWPALRGEAVDGDLAGQVELLRSDLEMGGFFTRSADRDTALKQVESVYQDLYQGRHARRAEVYQAAVDEIKAQADWPAVAVSMQETLLKPLRDRICPQVGTPDGLACPQCRASLAEMASDLAAADRLRSDVLMQMQRLLAPEEKVERVRFADVVGVGRALSSPEDVDKALDELRDYLLLLIASGAKAILE